MYKRIVLSLIATVSMSVIVYGAQTSGSGNVLQKDQEFMNALHRLVRSELSDLSPSKLVRKEASGVPSAISSCRSTPIGDLTIPQVTQTDFFEALVLLGVMSNAERLSANNH